MARLHNHALTYQPPAELAVLHFDHVFPFPEPVVLFDAPYASLFPPERGAVFKQAIAWAQESIDLLIAGGEPMRILHGDLHQWNVRIAHGLLSPIDFEDLMMGWPVQDIATTLYYFLDENYALLRMLSGRVTFATVPGLNAIPVKLTHLSLSAVLSWRISS